MQIFDETVKWRKSRLFLLFCKSLLRKDNEHLNTVIKRLKSPNTTLAEKNYLKKNTDDMNIIHNNNKTVKSICANTCRLTLVSSHDQLTISHLFLSFLNFFVPALHFFPSQCLWKQVFKRFNIKRTVLGIDFEVDWVEFFRQIVECRYSSLVALTLVCGDGPLHLQDLPTEDPGSPQRNLTDVP